MKIIRYKIFYAFRNFSLNNQDRSTSGMTIALLAMISFMYCTPIVALMLKMTGLLEFKFICWVIFGAFAFKNFDMIGRKYRAEINDAVNYLMFTELRVREKLLIATVALLSFPYLIVTMSLLKSAML